MTQKEKQLLLKDLCARLPYRVMIKSVGENKVIGLWDLKDVDNLPLPYLRPLSSMTEEERKELSYYENSVQITDFYYSHHIDCRFIIEKGLAIEAPENMYKMS